MKPNSNKTFEERVHALLEKYSEDNDRVNESDRIMGKHLTLIVCNGKSKKEKHGKG